MMNYKVSIIVPIYNREQCLRQCLGSIVAQTLREIEIILVDDGSTDGSSMICDEYAAADSRVCVIHKKNEGMGAAYNAGLNIAKGEYIGFVESDDWIEKKMYEDLYAKGNAQGADVVKGFFSHVIGGAIEKVTYLKNYSRYFNRRTKNILQVVPALAYGRPSHWSAIYKRSFLERTQIRFPETPGASMQDLDFFWQVYTCDMTCTIVPEYYYNCRRDSPDSSGSKGYQTVKDVLIAFERTFSLLTSRKVATVYLEMLVKRLYVLESRFSTDATYVRGIFSKIRHARLVSSLFKKCTNYVQFSQFSTKERCDFTLVLHHPYFYVLREYIHHIESDDAYYCRKLLGVKIIEIKKTASSKKTKLLYLPIKKKTYDDRCTRCYILGIPMKSAVKHDNYQAKYFMGIRYHSECLSTKESSPADDLVLKLSKIEESIGKLTDIEGAVRKLTDFAKQEVDYTMIEDKALEAAIIALNIRELHKKTFSSYRDMHNKRSVVIVGCGPSLNHYKQIPEAVHIGVNRAIMASNVELDYLFMQDFLNVRNIIEKACEYRKGQCVKFFGLFPRFDHPMHIPDYWAKKASALRYYIHDRPANYNEKIYYNIEISPLAHFWASSFQALHFAFHTNPRKIFLVGLDCSFSEYFNHAHPQTGLDRHGFSPREQNQHAAILKDGYSKFKRFREIYYPKTEVVSVNPVGLRGLYKDVYTEPFLREHPEIKNPTLLNDILEKDL